MPGKRVLSAGQCYADSGAITRTLQKHFGAEVTSVDSADEIVDRLRSDSFALILVNRIFDADGSSGIELIRRIKQDPTLRQTPIMLVSNYDDAQQDAMRHGAEPGFGKGALGHPAMLARLEPYLGPQA